MEEKAATAADWTDRLAANKKAIEAALARKRWMAPLTDAEIPVVKASVVRAQVNEVAR